MPSEPERGLEQLLAAKEIVVACGPGGVGKTTTAAALGATAALRLRAKVLVITVDPAKRLADALGLGQIGNDVAGVPRSAFPRGVGVPKGELSVAVLDASVSWDALVRRYATSAAAAEEIIANPLYRNITDRFVRSHEYIAMERLYELHASGDYDLIVVDTPPSQGALDFLDAPERMADFFSSRLLRWLTTPFRSRLVNLASKPFYQMADRVLGTQFLEDIGRFFLLLQGMYGGFVERANAVSALLREQRSTFVVVTTPEEAPLEEARRFVDALELRGLHLGVLVANKVLPAALSDAGASRVADGFVSRAGHLAKLLSDRGLGEEEELGRVLSEVGASFSNFKLLADRQRELLAEIGARHAVRIEVPHLFHDVVDLTGLLEVGKSLFDPTS